MARSGRITRLGDHPNGAEIRSVLARARQLDDRQLTSLARAWRNSVAVAEGRRRALEPDSPLVLEVLAAFDALAALYHEELRGGASELEIGRTALKAVRDAIAAAYARPVLSRVQYHALLAPWRQVFTDLAVCPADLGPRSADVTALLHRLGQLAGRCHDAGRQVDWELLETAAHLLDESAQDRAREHAWQAAVLSGRRRSWALARRSAAEGLAAWCPDCRRRPGPGELPVLQLGMDAVSGLLVADLADESAVATLTRAVTHLVPLPRRPAG